MKNAWKGLAGVAATAMLSAAVTGCGGNTAVSSPGGSSNGGGGSQAEEIINIGYTGPLSGGAAFYGQDVLNGIKMAVNEINDKGGITVNGKKEKFKVIELDDKYLPNESATNAKRLVQQYHTPIVFCPHSGGIMAIQGFNAKQEPNFLLAGYSSEPLILKQNNPLTVMIPTRYDSYFKPFAEKEMQTFGKKLGLVPGTHAYAKEWTKQFTEVWKSMGGQVLTDNGVDYNTTTDFSSAVSKALSEKPDVMFVGGASQPTALVIKAARDQGFKGGFVVMDQAKFESMAPAVVPLSALEGSVGVLPLENYPGPATKQFVDNYKKAFGADKVANSEVGLNYQTMELLSKAIELAGSTDPKAIRAKVSDAIKALPKEVQPYGVDAITPEGHLEGKTVAAFVHDGKFENLDIPSIQ